MISVNNVTLSFGKRVLFDEVKLNFVKGNCYGVIGANGAGKSTFLKILSKEIDPSSGSTGSGCAFKTVRIPSAACSCWAVAGGCGRDSFQDWLLCL